MKVALGLVYLLVAVTLGALMWPVVSVWFNLTTIVG
jgi:hypothetical protein